MNKTQLQLLGSRMALNENLTEEDAQAIITDVLNDLSRKKPLALTDIQEISATVLDSFRKAREDNQ